MRRPDSELNSLQHLERLLRTLPIAITTIVFAGFCVRGLSAQSISAGAVVGTVKDTTSQPMASVRVALADRTSGFVWAMTTENDGRPYAPGVVIDATGLLVPDRSGAWRLKPRTNANVVVK